MIPMPVVVLPPLIDDERQPDEIFHDAPPSFPSTITVRVEQPEMPFINAAKHSAPQYVKSWNDYVGQEPLKRLLRVYIEDSKARFCPLPHVLLASNTPGIGKTTMGRLIADEMEAPFTMLVPPFTPQTLYDALLSMEDWGVLFVDEIHKLADNGPRAAENLYHAMEEGVLYLDDGVHKLADFTIMGATTDPDKLPEPIVERFAIKPGTGAYFQPYTARELVRITHNFCEFFDVTLHPTTMVAIAKACRRSPRVARDLVVLSRALQNRPSGQLCTPQELLERAQLEPDGMTRQHIAYILTMYQFGKREYKDTFEYVMGEQTIVNVLREAKQSVARLERFLMERGLVDRTPRGRRLTTRGIIKARDYVARGMALNTE